MIPRDTKYLHLFWHSHLVPGTDRRSPHAQEVPKSPMEVTPLSGPHAGDMGID